MSSRIFPTLNTSSYALPESAQSEVVARIRAGDRAAFEELFRSYYAPLASFAHAHLGSREAAEEIVQDVFLYIWAHRSQWQVTVHLRSYLYTAVLNRVRSAYRARQGQVSRDVAFATDRQQATDGEARERS